MKLMAKASREIEQSKIEVQLKLFSERMAYAREKDLCLHESGLMANENAKLAIEKQGDVVKCLIELTYVLSRGMLPLVEKNSDQINTKVLIFFVDLDMLISVLLNTKVLIF